MESVNTASVAKEVTSGQSMKLILGKLLLTSEQLEFAFMHFYHNGIFKAANRTVTCCKLLKITRYLKLNGSTVATTKVHLV